MHYKIRQRPRIDTAFSVDNMKRQKITLNAVRFELTPFRIGDLKIEISSTLETNAIDRSAKHPLTGFAQHIKCNLF